MDLRQNRGRTTAFACHVSCRSEAETTCTSVLALYDQYVLLDAFEEGGFYVAGINIIKAYRICLPQLTQYNAVCPRSPLHATTDFCSDTLTLPWTHGDKMLVLHTVLR